MSVFTTPLNDISASISSPHTSGDGLLVFTDSSVFGSPTALNPIRVTVRYNGLVVIYKITGNASNTLTINSVIEGTSDITFPANTLVSMDFTAGHLSDIHTAVNTNETAIATKAADNSVIHLTGNETATGTKILAKLGVGTTPSAMLHVQPDGASDKVLILEAFASQTANLLECQNSSNIAISAIDGSGYGFIRSYTFILASGGAATTGTNKTNVLCVERNGKIVKAFIYAKTAPTGASFIVDINKNGTSIWASTQANRLSLTASSTSGTQTSFDTTAIAEGDLLTIDIDQIGSTIAAQDITVQLFCLLRNL